MSTQRVSASGGASVTIRDVASAAKVSPSTVSNLLNGRDARMHPRTRERVARAINELGYRPSRVARQLRTGRAQVIGLVVPSVANPFWGSFARTVEAEALRDQHQVLLCNSERDPAREHGYIEELWAGGVRSVILGTSLPSLDHLRPFTERGLRLVAFDRERQAGDPPGLVSVSVDNHRGGYLATQHLLDLGHRRIGFISGAIATVSRGRRLAGYRAALADARVRYRRQLVWSNPGKGFGDGESAELGRQGLTALLRLAEPPTAVVTINDMYAIGACAAARDAGLAVPGRGRGISIVGFDDITIAELYNPPLSTIRQPLADMARFALDAIRTQAGDGPESTVMAPQLVARASTARRSAREEKKVP
ncbi:LacI family DNA-binding transcriptional regulator [Actinopolymorpha sp. B11F2]|uniref:LacI family DNA-binding transcriptional regulator n=1 Tax=Actinopolymorpha sp. B11F2 TaxID=3160862 RepID=UPI0032E4DDF0